METKRGDWDCITEGVSGDIPEAGIVAGHGHEDKAQSGETGGAPAGSGKALSGHAPGSETVDGKAQAGAGNLWTVVQDLNTGLVSVDVILAQVLASGSLNV